MRVLNSGTLVERRIDLDYEVNPRYDDTHDAVERLIELVRDASRDLTNVRFETETESGPHGSSETHALLVYGTPTGDLAAQAKRQYEQEREREERARVESARRALREAGRRR